MAEGTVSPARVGNPRAVAAQALIVLFEQGRSLSSALPVGFDSLSGQDRALARELTYGVARWYLRLNPILDQLLHKGLKRRDRDVRCLLLVGLYQLLETRIPPHAAVAETVAGAHGLGKDWAKGLVNATLRRFLRQRQGLLAAVDGALEARLAHPKWLTDKLQAAYPSESEAICEANNQRPPMTLRVNRLQSERQAYVRELCDRGLDAWPAAHTPSGLILAAPTTVDQLPGFDAGRVSVQDGAAQLAASLLEVPAGARVLDACAAPGGKTAHLLEAQPEAEVWALDHTPQRLTMVKAGLDRLGLNATTAVADAAEPAAWWDGQPFDRILVDAPCSGTGVIRRHPDIKYLRRSSDLAALCQTQARLLSALWPLLAPGGRLLYCTCSLLPEENGRQVERFLATHTDTACVALEGPWGRPVGAGRQILPGEDDMDGFYYALVEKQ